ncbi:MAG: hypothetical protein MUC97_08630 [Bernardetiaceae bacterium]|jgi:DNA repair exonuclease SbcCD ATPase subunit|nr:hypothetical protein [Bernardetiaceae bacterium]
MKSQSTFVIILFALLAVGLAWWGFASANKLKDREKAELGQLKSDLSALEDRLNTEISNTQDPGFFYPNADSMRTALSGLAENVQNDQKMITNKPAEVVAKLTSYQNQRLNYERALNTIVGDRDRSTGGYISGLKTQMEKAKTDLDAAIKKNRALSAQLQRAVRNFRGAQKELNALKARQKAAESLGTDLDALRTQLSMVMEERDQLRTLIDEKDRTIARQDSIIAAMQQKTQTSVARRVYDFRAQYLFKRLGRDYNVDLSSATEEHRAGRIDEILVSFRAGESLFDDTDDKMVYLTMYKDNEPYRFVRLPIRVASDEGRQTLDVRKPRLESGSYTVRVFYKEEQVMPDYKFSIR